MKKNNNKINLLRYLKPYKFGIAMYILVYLVAAAANIFMTLLLANAIELITLKSYHDAIITLAIVAALYLLRRACWYSSGIIYNKYANRIMADLNLDLAEQAFKLNSKTYSDNDTGTFVQRIVNDPEQIVSRL